MIILLTGTLIQLIFVKIKPLIVSSSIVHIGWITIPQRIVKIFPLIYLAIYTIVLIPLILILKKTNKWKLIKTEQKNNFILTLNIFNLRNVPPLTGFILKWIVFSLLIHQKTNIIYILVLFIIATISFYIYFQIIYNNLTKNYMNIKYKINSKIKSINSVFLLLTIILPIFIII